MSPPCRVSHITRKESTIAYFEYSAVVAVILALSQLFGPNIRGWLQPHASLVSSFGGGVAIAYVCLTLFPEIDVAHEWLGEHVHIVTLVSFLAFYTIEMLLIAHIRRTALLPHPPHQLSSPTARAFWFHIAIIWIYIWMILYTMPDRTADSLFFAIFGSLTISLHLVYKDFVLRSKHDAVYQASGRYLLAIAPIAGWIAHHLFDPSEVVLDVFIAILAGVILQGVFREELPGVDAVKLPWLIGGAATFTALITII